LLISIYLSAFMIPSICTKAPTPLDKKHAYIIKDPSSNLTVGVMNDFFVLHFFSSTILLFQLFQFKFTFITPYYFSPMILHIYISFLAKAKRLFILNWLMCGLRLALQYLNPTSCNLRRTVSDDTLNFNIQYLSMRFLDFDDNYE